MGCYKCGKEVVIESSIYCDACGARLDGKMNCRKCNGEIMADAKFCNLCGASCTTIAEQELRKEQSEESERPASANAIAYAGGEDEVRYVTRPRQSDSATNSKFSTPNFWVGMGRNVLLFIFSVIIFSLSFGGVMTITTPSLGVMGKVNVKVTTVNMVEAMFSLGTADTSEDMMLEMQTVLTDNVSSAIFKKISSGETLSSIEKKEVNKALSKFNYLKVGAASDIRAISPASAYVNLLGMGLLALAVIVGSGVFMILSLVSLILAFVKMDFSKVNRGKWYAFAVPFLLVLSLIAFVVGESSMSINGNAIAIMILSLMGLGVTFSAKYILTREHVCVKTLVGRLVSVGLAIAMMLTVSSSMITANYTFSNADGRNLKASHGIGAMSYIVAADMLANVDTLSEVTAENYSIALQEIVRSSSSGLFYKVKLAEVLSSTTSPFEWFFLAESYRSSAAIGWLFGTTPIFVLGLIGLCFVSVVFNIKNIYNSSKKKSNLLVNIFTIVSAVGLFAYSLVAVLSINSITSVLGGAMLTMTIGAGSILLLIFSIGNLVQSLILNPKKKVVYVDAYDKTV